MIRRGASALLLLAAAATVSPAGASANRQAGDTQPGRTQPALTEDSGPSRPATPADPAGHAAGKPDASATNTGRAYVGLGFALLFLAPFVNPRKPLRLLHLDLAVLLGFGLSQVFFYRGELSKSVPLAYPVLAYLLVRMLVIGLRSRQQDDGPLLPICPARWLAVGVVVLVVIRIAVNVTIPTVSDVGYASVVGADRLEHGQELYDGSFPLLGHGSTQRVGSGYGPMIYMAYVPFEQVLPWRGVWDWVPAAHAAAITFDLLTLLGLFLLGRRLGPGPTGNQLGVVLAFAWASYPYTLLELSLSANNSLVAMLLTYSLLAFSSPAGRGLLLGLAAAAKWFPLALAPLFAVDVGARRLRNSILFLATLLIPFVLLWLPFLPDAGLRELYNSAPGRQAGTPSPYTLWSQYPALDFLRAPLRIAAVGLALLLYVLPPRKELPQVAALGAAVIIAVELAGPHWFYPYIVWFAPYAFVALFARPPAPGPLRPVG